MIAERGLRRIVDIGGGSGARAVPLASAGGDVAVVDVSTDALASLARRAADAGVADRIEAIQADADHLAGVLPPESVDLVLFHRMLDQVADPVAALADVVALLRQGGVLSVVVPGRMAAVTAAARAGRWEDIERLLDGEGGHESGLELPVLSEMLEQVGLAVESVTGIGVLGALAADRFRGSDEPALARAEALLATHPVLGRFGTELHAVGYKPFA